MKTHATLRYLNISPRKVRSVVEVIRGLPADEAVRRLRYVPKRAARPLEKLLRSAIANAENNLALDPKTLKIDSLRVDGGPALKRYRPRALGRAALIKRQTSHITVVLEGERTSKPAAAKPKTQAVVPEVSQEEMEKIEKTPKKEFEVEKKVGREQRPSFVKRLFRRKAV